MMKHIFSFLVINFSLVLNSQEVSFDSIFRAYNKGQYISYTMEYTIESIPDSVLNEKIAGKMSVYQGKDVFRYLENGIEYVLTEGVIAKVNHNKKYIELVDENPMHKQMDFSLIKDQFTLLGVEAGVLNKNNKSIMYYFKFPNADSTACIMSQDIKTGLINEYKYNLWAQAINGEYYLKKYSMKYTDYKLNKKNKLKSIKYIAKQKNGAYKPAGICRGYEIKKMIKY